MTAKGKTKKINKQKELVGLLTISSAILIILLTILNLQKISKRPSGVLGISTATNNSQLEQEKNFWEEFLAKNPTYYDGWKRISEIEYLTGNYDFSEQSKEISNRIDPSR